MKDTDSNKQVKEIVLKALHCVAAHILMNLYADENTVFGHIKVNEQIPFDKYINDLGLREFAQYLDINLLDGHAIENGYIKDRSYDEICFKLYKDKIDALFDKAPSATHFARNDNPLYKH